MAEAIVNFAIETIGNLLIEEGKFLHGVSDQVEELQLELRRLRSFLRDADQKQHDDEMIQDWISQTRDLAYEAEDLIESYAFKLASQKKNILKRCACILNECYVRHSIGSEIQTLKTKISDLIKSSQDYGITAKMEREACASADSQLRRTYSHVVEDDFIGFELEVEMLVEQLVKENEADRHGILSIYGMGGIGKTTLARKLYNHPKLKRLFEGFVWVCISQKWQKMDILQGILINLVPQKRNEIEKWRDEELIRELFQIQHRRKCLVVLDDVWSTDVWDCIKEAFPIGKYGGKILITTRNREVAYHIGPFGYHFETRLLSEQESCELLQRKALRGRHDQDPGDILKMENIGKKIVKYCGGLPLAIVVFGGILVTKRNVSEWESLEKNVKAYLGKGKYIAQNQVGEIPTILGLSYNDLPQKLKPCFLYLSRYPEDCEIYVETLCQLWIAEGMISMTDQMGEESLMDVAERYLEELAERFMVQLIENDTPSATKYDFCCLHDLIRDLSLQRAEKENFLFSFNSGKDLDNGEVYNSSSSSKIHRLSIRLSGDDVPKYVPPPKRMAKHLRSLAFVVLGDGYNGRMPSTVKAQLNLLMLRVLAIEGLTPSSSCIDPVGLKKLLIHLKLPKAIGNLIHLRYLSLKDSSFLRLPSSLGNLQHLQTLDLRLLMVLRIPNVLWRMKQLRYLYLPNMVPTKQFRELQLDGLSKLEILESFNPELCSAKGLSKLNNLRALSVSSDINREKELLEIIEFISNSTSLRYAYLSLQFVNMQRRSIYTSIGRLLSLSLPPASESFELFKESINVEKGSMVLRKLLSCRNLDEFKLVGPIGRLPENVDLPFSTINCLTFLLTQIQENPMETLGLLPNLQFLQFEDNSYVGKELFCGALSFPKLTHFLLSNLPNLEKWSIVEGAMPNLENLSISECKKLEMIPDGLRFLRKLEYLSVEDMHDKFKERVRVIDGREGEDFDKVRHVSSIRFGF